MAHAQDALRQSLGPVEPMQRSPQERAALSRNDTIEAERMARERYEAQKMRGTGLGAPIAGLINMVGRGGKMEGYTSEALRGIESARDVADYDATRDYDEEQRKQTGTNRSFAPVTVQGPNDEAGNPTYSHVQYSNTGSAPEISQLPEGYTAMPNAGQMAYDPGSIATRGAADLDVDLANTSQVGGLENTMALQQAGDIGAQANTLELEQQANMNTQEVAQGVEANYEPKFNEIRTLSQKIPRISDDISWARENTDGWTAGLLGGQLARLDGTAAYDLRARMDRLKGDSGLTNLLALKDSGGSLGQITRNELDMLSAGWGNLDSAQSPGAFKTALDEYERMVNQIYGNKLSDFNRTYPDRPFQPEGAPSEADARRARVQEILARDAQ